MRRATCVKGVGPDGTTLESIIDGRDRRIGKRKSVVCPLFHMIHSPGVPVFRDDDGNRLAEPYRVTIVSALAGNRTALTRNEPERHHEAQPTMRRRMTRMFVLARHQGHRRLVLGAWAAACPARSPTMSPPISATCWQARLPSRPLCLQ